jgi:hypothetical protein
MRLRTRLLLAAAASVGLAGLTSPAQGALLLHYNFEDGTDQTINNQGTTATAGTLTNSNNAAPDTARFAFVRGFVGNPAGIGSVDTGTALRLSPAGQNNAPEDAFIRTGQTAPQLAASSSSYTMMAWVNVADFRNPNGTGDNDNMIFGQNVGGNTGNDQYLHNGFRGAKVHQGHWGNDERTGPDLSTGTWYHVAYVYDGAQMTQYVNGEPSLPDELEGTPPTNNAENPLASLTGITIGRTGGAAAGSGNNGNFNGMFDEVKMFDTVLTQEQVRQEAAVFIPEPASLGLLGLGAVGLLCRRRRPQA